MSNIRDIRVKLPFVPIDEAYLVYPKSSLDPVEWDEIGESLSAPFIEGKVWKAAILENIAIALEGLAKPESGHKVPLQALIDQFPGIEVNRLKRPTWEALVQSLANVEEVVGGVVTLKPRQRPTLVHQARGEKLRVQVLVDGEMLGMLSDRASNGPRNGGLNANAFLRLITSKFENAQIVSSDYIACRPKAVDKETERLEESLLDAGFKLSIFPKGKLRMAQTCIFGLCRTALENSDIDAVAILTANENLIWRIEDLVKMGKSVILLTCGGVTGGGSSSRLASAASQVVCLDQLAAKPRSRRRLENELFASRESGD